MKLKHCFLLVGLFSNFVTEAGTIYQYKLEDGSTFLSNKLSKTIQPEKKTYYVDYNDDKSPDSPRNRYSYWEDKSQENKKYRELTSGSNPKSRAINNYLIWLENGKKGLPPLIPETAHNEIGFAPIIKVSLMSGNGFIDSRYIDSDFTYENYNDCMSEKNENLSDARKKYNFNLNKDIKYPSDTRKVYEYSCIRRLLDVRVPVISQKELMSFVHFVTQYEAKLEIKRQNEVKKMGKYVPPPLTSEQLKALEKTLEQGSYPLTSEQKK